jgi:NADPH:quinone reductase-like Zn-dependent oxidoreductase
MKAARREVYGPPTAVVSVRDVDRPIATGDHIVVRVHAASVNRADLDGLYPRWAFTRLITGLRVPRVQAIGLDAAGVVESVGPDATRFKVGDRVYADLFAFGAGAFGEYVGAPERAFRAIPADLGFEEAATLPHSAVLAVQGLRLRNGRTVGPGDKVLISGASGNVGPFAVQIAKARGAEVTGSSSAGKLDFVRSLGADHVFDYAKVDYAAAPERYDWIVDVEARHSVVRTRRALKPGGVYVSLGGPSSTILDSLVVAPFASAATGKRLGLLLWWKPFNPPDVATVEELVGAGKLVPRIDRRYPLSDVVEALRWVDEGRARGKVIVTP